MTRNFDIETAITIPAMPALLIADLTADLDEATTFGAPPIDDTDTSEIIPLARDIAPAMTGSTRVLRAHSAPLAWRVAAHARAVTSPWWCSCGAPIEVDARCLTCGGAL